MVDVEMNKGVQILLERMSSNPDEFVPTLRDGYSQKWRNILISVEMRVNGGKDYKDQLAFLTDKEVKALWEKMQSLRGDLFTKQVMNTLLSESTELSFDYANTANMTASISRLAGASATISINHPPTTLVPPLTPAELSSLSRQVAGGSPKGSF
jgi:hypothetical protein